MRTALHRIAAGALAYVVSYVLIGLATVPRLGRYLVRASDDAVTVLDVYRSAGSPLWQAVGWFTLNAHGVPIDIAAVRDTGNFVSDGAMWLGILPGWLGLVPLVACLLVGVTVTATNRSSPVPMGVGAYMVPGYLVALLLSTVVFAGGVGPVTASARVLLPGSYPGGRWLLLVVLAPLVFGSLGASLGQSPVLTATVERLRSDLSLR
ncbi:hypothetical protein [Halorussus aquaticus]|uniref:DUF7978 domain-containing protein n=1 Tax=Halorussus aquaticus TaxID=2953748 RepID=A0ABD5Q4T7_9EURY|nr:hypothetical protein [Halorussus aquaticus]